MESSVSPSGFGRRYTRSLRSAYNDLLGIRTTEVHDDGLTVAMEIRPELYNFFGVLHGGASASLVDAAMGIAITHHFPERQTATVELKINYMRPVSTGTVRARARFIKTGKTLIVGEVVATREDGKEIARALMTYILMPGPAPASK